MSQTRTQKSRWFSSRSNSWISDSQKLAEFICERMADSKKLILPQKFWEDSFWMKIHRQQLTLASKLLKEYSCELILEVLKSSSGRTSYSLGAPWLKQLLEQERGKINRTIRTNEEVTEQSPLFDFPSSDKEDSPKRKSPQQNILSRIKELE